MTQKADPLAQIMRFRQSLTNELLRQNKLEADLKACRDSVTAITNLLAGVELAEQAAAQAAELAAPEKVIGTAKVGDQVIPLIDDTENT